jgi:hypothetical protein
MQSTLRAALLTAALSASFVPAFAEDPIVKPAPAQPPAAGPTLTAAQAFCGEAPGKAEELLKRYSTDPKLKEVYKSNDYVAYSDDPKSSTVMYTFTRSGHPAHPAAVCRKPEKDGDNLIIKMVVVCDGEASACGKLSNDFNVMTAKMQADADQKFGAAAKK